MNIRSIDRTDETGSVSIFSVIFFIILTSIITVGFVRIVNIEQRQAIDNSSSANALAAARSGIEDGKRVLLLAERLKDNTDASYAPLKTAVNGAIGNPDCDAIQGNIDITDELGIDPDGKVYQDGGDGGQFYTCLTIDKYTTNYTNEAKVGNSVIVPLKTKDGVSFDTIRFLWHNTSRDGIPTAEVGFAGKNPTFDALDDKKTPSYMRLQLIKVPKANNVTPTNITSQTGFLRTSVLIARATAFLSLNNDLDLGTAVGDIYQPTAACSMTDAYACAADVTFGGSTDPTFDYYLRVTALYRATSFQVEMIDPGLGVIKFDGVQPIVDATGKSGDTFRRIQARVGFSPRVDLPEFVAESTSVDISKGICKDVTIASGGGVSSTCWTP
ncbi:hypothetical protein EOL73_02095 [Candidatus Saccharibacteria bacterium]|nr:hypothetical protein [Candidatus Saccharibacteria bacterium]NCU40528.1 hypothetical protein [Candidatus Saccharibacteria bacterium]